MNTRFPTHIRQAILHYADQTMTFYNSLFLHSYVRWQPDSFRWAQLLEDAYPR